MALLDPCALDNLPYRGHAGSMTKTSIHVRVTPEKKQIFMQAAENLGLDLSAWLTMLGSLAAAHPELLTLDNTSKKVAEKVPEKRSEYYDILNQPSEPEPAPPAKPRMNIVERSRQISAQAIAAAAAEASEE